MTAAIDMTGATVNGIHVVAAAGSRNGKRTWLCVCHCGASFEAVGTELREGRKRGCLACSKQQAIRSVTKHGGVGTREYVSYSAMRQRCLYDKNKRYARYGGRGVSICARWLESFVPKLPGRHGAAADRRSLH